MLLGQLVSISVASNLFYLALLLASTWQSPPSSRNTPKTAPLYVSLPILISLLAIAVSPFTDGTTFLPNLLIMHGVLIIPLLPFPSPYPVKSTRFSINIRSLYILITIIALILRTKTIHIAISSLPPTTNVSGLTRVFNGALYETLYSHPAQSSIGWDVVWTTISLFVWLSIGPTHQSLTDFMVMIFGLPMDGVGAVAPWIFRKGMKRTEAKKA